MPDEKTYVTRAEFEGNADEMRRNFGQIRDEIREMKNLKNWTTGMAAAAGSGVAYALINLFNHGGHF